MQTQNHFGAFVLCASISKIFPREQICFSEAGERGFSVEFTHSEPFQEAYLQMLEKKMRELADEELIESEMLASNAAGLFLHHGQTKAAESLQHLSGTVTVGQMGDFIGLCTGELERARHFSLYQFEQTKKRVVISGIAFESADKQKIFLKKLRQYPKKCGAYLGEQLDLFELDVWHPRGMALRRALVERWRKELAKAGVEEIEAADPQLYFEKTGRKKFSCFDGLEDRIYCFNEDSLISSLQFIQKWINIFNFESQLVLVKPTKILKEACGIDCIIEKGEKTRVEVRIADALGRYWTGAALWLKKNGVEFSLFGNLELFIRLLLESTEGDLPFWLAPVQLMLFPMEGVDPEPLVKIFERQNIRFSIDVEPVLLKEKMHRALRAKVPYVMVFGKREESAKQMSIRTCGSKDEIKMNLEELEHFLAERQLENQ